ncbi:MAG: S8 family serine peptidase [Actinomycetota bacterium]|nr:S8 family serine peptidase [Actinomycetota bacterium]
MTHRGGPFSRSTIRRRHLAYMVALSLVVVAAPPVSAGPAEGRDRYVIVLDDAARPAAVAAEHERRYAGDVTHVYNDALRGYAAELPQEAAAAIARDERVAFVEPDHAVTALAQTTPTGIARISAPANGSIDIDGTDDARVDVDIAIIDTGVQPDHPDLNVVRVVSCLGSGSVGGCVEGAGEDDNGHGTHVAGTAAALDNGVGVVGVAPGARIHSVKVLTAPGTGLMSDVIGGIDWVTHRADTIEVANMSLGCDCQMDAFDVALAASVNAGVVHVVAAGNDDHDARDYSPAGHPDAITVSALTDFDGTAGGRGSATCYADEDDTLARFSNWGPAVDIVAPGTCILSTSLLGGYRTLSGTSMASPHVAGAAAVLTSGANDPRDGADVDAVHHVLTTAGNFGWFDDSNDGTTEPLLDVGDPGVFAANSATRTLGTAPPPPPDNEPPIASFTHSCSNTTCTFDAAGSSDPDGTIAAYAWSFGDGTSGSGATATKTYDAAGSYTVSLTVTDDEGAVGGTSTTVTVTSDDGGGGGEDDFLLRVTWVRGWRTATVYLEWSGTDRAGSVIIYRNGVVIATTPDDGSFTDHVENPSGSLTYRVCEEDTTRCSNERTI